MCLRRTLGESGLSSNIKKQVAIASAILRISMGRNNEQGRGGGRAGRGSRQGRGRGGFSNAPSTVKKGMTEALGSNIFTIAGNNAADVMRITEDKIAQYVGKEYGVDIGTEIQTKTKFVVPLPQHSPATIAAHVTWEDIQRRKQTKILALLELKKNDLEAKGLQGDDVALELVEVEAQIEEKEYEITQPVEYNLTDTERTEYNNAMKTYSYRVASLDKQRGQVYALIYGQCTTALQDKMKAEVEWTKVNNDKDPLELYKLIEKLVLKQTDDQYPLATMWEQYKRVFNAVQPSNATNHQWAEQLSTMVEVAQSIGCDFGKDRALEYCAKVTHNKRYDEPLYSEQVICEKEAFDRFMAYAIIKTSDTNKNGKVKTDLADDYIKDKDNYPTDKQQALLLLDRYSKDKPTAAVQSEGTSFAQSGKKGKSKDNKDKKDSKDKDDKDDDNKPKKEFNKEFYKDKDCHRCGAKGHPAFACTTEGTFVKKSSSSSSSNSVSNKDMAKLGSTLVQLGGRMGGSSNDFNADDNEYDDHSHAQFAVVCDTTESVTEQQSEEYTFATRKNKSRSGIREYILLDNQSSKHIFCERGYLQNIRTADGYMDLHSNGGQLHSTTIGNYEGFDEDVWHNDQAITNVLSLTLVKKEYPVSYDGEAFIIHRAASGYSDMVFVPHPSGLHVWDPQDPRGLASYVFVETVAEIEARFPKRDVRRAQEARDLAAGLAFPSDVDLAWILKSNQIRNCPLTDQDAKLANTIYGRDVALLKGKTTRKKPLVVTTNIVAVPKEVRMLYNKVTLAIDIFFVNKVPFFITFSLKICFLSVTHLTNRKAPSIFNALRSMHNYYLQRGFTIVFIKADGEFKPLEEMMYELYGSPKLNLASANEHVPDIERQIRVVKERTRAVVYSMKFNRMPEKILNNIVLFVVKMLNLFPRKGGSPHYSPKQLMSGEITDYKSCSMGCGHYCQIHEETAPRNSLAPRTQGAISLGPSGNVQGGHKFYVLRTKMIVVRRNWTRLPMTDDVIKSVERGGMDMPSQPVFTDRKGNVIGDGPSYYNNNPQEAAEDVDDLPGLLLDDPADDIP